MLIVSRRFYVLPASVGNVNSAITEGYNELKSTQTPSYNIL